MPKLTAAKQDKALAIVAEWLGPQMGYDGPAPTGERAAYSAAGPMLNRTWDWPSEPTPTILLEGGPDAWAIEVAGDPDVVAKLRKVGVFAEPWAGYALCLYEAW